jgi:DNA polymerase-3 subunit beta
MKFTAHQKAILPALQHCASVADLKGTLPALANVRLTANGAINLSATDLYQSVTMDADGAVAAEGSIAVHARDLLDRVKVLPGEITFSLDHGSLVLKSGSRRFKLATIPADEMPALPTQTDERRDLFVPTGDDLVQLIDRVLYAVSTDETRLHLNSMYLGAVGGKLTAVATDGHRLAVYSTETEAAFSPILIPLKGLLQIKRLAESAGVTPVPLSVQNADLFASIGIDMGVRPMAKNVLSVRLCDHQFPPWADVVPKSHSGTTTIDRQALLDACKAVAVAASDRTGGVKLSFTQSTLKLSSESPEGGDGGDEIACTHDGPEVEIGVNARYLEQALGVIEGEEVVIGSSGELDPITIKAAGDTSGSVAVTMPMRVA